MKKIFSKETAIGFSVILALAILIFGIDYLKGGKLFGGSNYYYVKFHNVEGLAEAATVSLDGFKVGSVGKIRYDYENPGNVIVELYLDKEMKVPAGTTATLTSDLLGTASITLHLGQGSTYLNIGDYLDGNVDGGMLQAVSQEVLPGVSVIAEKTDSLLSNLNALVTDAHIANSLANIESITRDLAKVTAQVNTVVANLQPIVNNVKSITTNVDGITSDVGELTSGLKQLPLDSIMTDLQATADNLRQLSQQLNDPNSSLGQLMSNGELYNNLNHTVASLDSLFIDIKKNPKRYVTIKVF